MKRVGLFLIAVGLTYGAPSGARAAVSLYEITPLGTDTTTEARAITADGQYVVGSSGSQGIIWDLTNGTRAVTSNHTAPVLTGVGLTTVAGQPRLVAEGLSGGWCYQYLSSNGGASWTEFSNANVSAPSGHAGQVPNSNSVRGSSTDVYYAAFTSGPSTNGRSVIVDKGSGAGPTVVRSGTSELTNNNQNFTVWGVSGTGRAVGQRVNAAGVPRNTYVDFVAGYVPATSGSAAPNGTTSPVFFNGLDGGAGGYQTGTAFSVSEDGNTIFGNSPVLGGRTGNWPYKVVNPGASQTINELPHYNDTAGSASNAIPYGASADGNFAVGMNYRGSEKAVIWNTSDANPANWTILDLTDYAQANGLLGNFTRLYRAFSIAQNGSGELVISGNGTIAGGLVRGFVLTLPGDYMGFVPEPTTLGLLAVGGLMLRRKRR